MDKIMVLLRVKCLVPNDDINGGEAGYFIERRLKVYIVMPRLFPYFQGENKLGFQVIKANDLDEVLFSSLLAYPSIVMLAAPHFAMACAINP